MLTPVCCAHFLPLAPPPDGCFLRALPSLHLDHGCASSEGCFPYEDGFYGHDSHKVTVVCGSGFPLSQFICAMWPSRPDPAPSFPPDPQILCLLPQGPLEMPLFLRCSVSESLLPSRGLSLHRTGLSNQLVPTEYMRIKRL